MTNIQVMTVGLWLLACSRPDAVSNASPNGIVPAQANVPVDKLVLQARGVKHGASNYDPSGVQRFAAPLTVLFKDVQAILTQRARYVTSDGSVVRSVVDAEQGKTPADSSVRVVAAEPLKADTWNWLVIDVDPRFTIEDPDVEQVANATSWSTHFFTGSAPHIVRVEVPTGSKGPSPVTVTLSEPVDLAGLDQPRLLTASGASITRCVLRGTDCWVGSQGWISDILDVALTVTQLPGSLTVALNGSLMGSSQTVAATRGVTDQTDAKSDGISVALTAAELKPLRDGAELVWAEQKPFPSIKP